MPVKYGHYDLRLGRGGTGNMVGQFVDVADNLGAAIASRFAAYAALKGNVQTAVSALVGANF